MDSTPESTVEITEVMTDELAAQQPGARMGGSNGVMHWTLHQLHHEIMQIPQSTLHSLKMELGYGDRDISNLDYAEKHRMVLAWRARQTRPQEQVNQQAQLQAQEQLEQAQHRQQGVQIAQHQELSNLMQNLNLTQIQAGGAEHVLTSNQGATVGSRGQPPMSAQQQQSSPTMMSAGMINGAVPFGVGAGGGLPRNLLPNGDRHQQQPGHSPDIMSTSLLGMPPSGGGLSPADLSLFDNAFMDIGSEFDPSTLFRPDGDINFERDFGQWFNPDDTALGGGLNTN